LGFTELKLEQIYILKAEESIKTTVEFSNFREYRYMSIISITGYNKVTQFSEKAFLPLLFVITLRPEGGATHQAA